MKIRKTIPGTLMIPDAGLTIEDDSVIEVRDCQAIRHEIEAGRIEIVRVEGSKEEKKEKNADK